MHFIRHLWAGADPAVLEVYKALVREQSLGIPYEAQSRAGPLDPVIFTKESFRLSMKEPDEDAQPYRAHLELSRWMIASENRWITNPAITNAHLCGHSHRFSFRTGAPYALDHGLPAGKHSEELLRLWMQYAEEAVEQYRDASWEERDLVTWLLHDILICLRVFDDANGRTARLHFLEPRRALGLPYVLLRHAQADMHRQRVRYCRAKIVVPMLREHNYL